MFSSKEMPVRLCRSCFESEYTRYKAMNAPINCWPPPPPPKPDPTYIYSGNQVYFADYLPDGSVLKTDVRFR